MSHVGTDPELIFLGATSFFFTEEQPCGSDSHQLYFPFMSACGLNTPLCFSFIVLLSTCQSVLLLTLEVVESHIA